MVAILDTPTDRPSTHAFVIGVSRYLHLDDGPEPTCDGTSSQLEQLTSGARSASEFAAWVLTEYRNPDRPLASLRVCLAPSDGEQLHSEIAAQLGNAKGATRAAVMPEWLAFRARCRETRNSVAIIYVAGHGVQLSKTGTTLLLEDFAGENQESKLWAALDLKGLHASMNDAQTATQQFWFIDACREPPEIAERFESLDGAYCGDVGQGSCDASPMFLASGPRKQAWARTRGVSLFNEALLACLRRDAAIGPQTQGGPWRVTTGSLAQVLRAKVSDALKGSGRDQMVELTGFPGTTAEILHEFAEPPEAQLFMTLAPIAAQSISTATLSLDNTAVVDNADDWPLKRQLKGGLYVVSIATQQPFLDTMDAVAVTLPRTDHIVKVRQ